MGNKVLLIATFDTKEQEAIFLKECLENQGVSVITMDAGILSAPQGKVDIDQFQVAQRGGTPLNEIVSSGDKGKCILNMMRGTEVISRELYEQGLFSGIIGIGGAQGTDIACAAMRALPTGVPKLMVSTVASGRATFGPYVGTKDITMMHSVVDMQGLNFVTKHIMNNAANAICGMVKGLEENLITPERPAVAVSMLGTTTPGALRCKQILENNGFDVVTFHQNGTGGIAMEDMIRDHFFKGVLDLNLHEIGDLFVGGLHGSIRSDRLEGACELGIPQVVTPGSINYAVWGPVNTLPNHFKNRRYVVHNPNLTLVRLSPEELYEVGKLVARKLNRSKGNIKVFIPLKGFSYPDREGLPHWEPEGNRAFIDALKSNILSSIPVTELDAHINDSEFIDPVTDAFLDMMEEN